MGSSEWLLFLSGTLTIFYIWVKHHYAYWRRKNVPSIEPNLIFGNLKEMVVMSSSPAEQMGTLYNHKNAQNQPCVGIYAFNKPALLIRDPELIKSILIKDFNKFSNRYSTTDPHRDALGTYSLFFIKNPLWREIRTKLTPVFTSGKIKQMFPLIEEIGSELDKYLCSLPLDPKTNSCVHEVKNITALYSTDVIASVAYGIQANSLKNPDCEFRQYGKSIFDFTPYRAFELSIIFFLPQLVKLFSCKVFPKAAAKFIRDTINFVMAERIKSGVPRNDLIDVLVAFQKAAEINNDIIINNDMLVGQAAAFFAAGFETTSSPVSFGMYELSKRPAMQERLRGEIKEALMKADGKITYQLLKEMEYLDMFLHEVLRMYPPLPFLDRECTLPNAEKEHSLQPHSDFGVPNQMPVYIPVYAIHRDPRYFPNPEEFDPERFSPENKKNIVPCTYMPFGIGPHNCIGERFAFIQAKIGLINFLRNHYVTTCEKTLQKMVFNPKALFIQAKGGIYCKLVRDQLLS